MGAYQSRASKEKTTNQGQSNDGRYRWVSSSMQGWRSSMEDADIAVTDFGGDPDTLLFGVFDGHGGSEVAAFCQKYFASVLSSRPEYKAGDYAAAFRAAYLHLDQQIRSPSGLSKLEVLLRSAEENHETSDDSLVISAILQNESFEASSLHEVDKFSNTSTSAGSTAVVALIKGNSIHVANAGDSRCVLSRNAMAVPLSDDHKPNNELEYQRITRAGGIVTRDNRVQGSLALSRALGDFEFKTHPTLGPEEQMVTALPDVTTEQFNDDTDEFVILACDGLFEVQSWQSLVSLVHQLLAEGMELPKIVETALDASLASVQGAQGSDNMTMQIILLPTTACARLLAQGEKYKESMRELAEQKKHEHIDSTLEETNSDTEDLRTSDDVDALPNNQPRQKRTLQEIQSTPP